MTSVELYTVETKKVEHTTTTYRCGFCDFTTNDGWLINSHVSDHCYTQRIGDSFFFTNELYFHNFVHSGTWEGPGWYTLVEEKDFDGNEETVLVLTQNVIYDLRTAAERKLDSARALEQMLKENP